MKKKFEAFLVSKGLTEELLKEKSAEELAGLYNEFNAEQTKALEELVEAKATKEDILALKEEMLDSQKSQLEGINSALKELGVQVKEMAYGAVGTKGEQPTIASVLKDNEEGLQKLKNSSSAADNVKIELKAVGDMSIAGNTTGQIPQAHRVEGYNDTPSRKVRLLDVVTKGGISSNLVEWVFKSNEEGSAGQTAEGATKNQLDFELTVGSEKVQKTTAYITVTDEMLDDVSYMATAIRTELTRELMKAIETQVYSGDGISPNMRGIRTVATAFTGSGFTGAAGVENPNAVDVLTVAEDQILVANQEAPNYIFMHPSDVTALKLVKVTSTDKRYVERLALVAGNLSLDGTPIIATTLVVKGQYLIGNFAMAFVLEKQAVTLEIGYNADNFVKNYKTIRAEWRGVTFVKNNDRTAFVKGVFATDIATITKV